MNLVVDIGNSRTKIYLFNPAGVMWTVAVEQLTPEQVKLLCAEHPSLDRAIISAVKNYAEPLKETFQSCFRYFLELDENTPLPIVNRYQSRSTLGKDRLAAAVGANFLFPNTNLLVIDAGTAITYDIVTAAGEYAGGNISPGLEMRFKALHSFTGKLPLVKPSDDFDRLGTSTETAIRAGVQNGILFEVVNTIRLFNDFYENLQIIFTGGDAIFFERKLKNSFFVDSNLVGTGLNRILEYNAKNS